jgi:XTP/dITP diphosphohydrolase
MTGSADQSPSALVELTAVMARLRRECAWKAEQTHASLVRYLVEEAYEVIEAIETGTAAEVREELGDLLLQVYFHAAIAAEAGSFDIEDVAAGLLSKLYRRNPHVFDPAAATAASDDAAAIDHQWQQIKAAEKPERRDSDLMAGVPDELPALLRAVKALDRLEQAGVPPRLTADPNDVGERLLALVAEARQSGIDPEQALRAAVRGLTTP